MSRSAAIVATSAEPLVTPFDVAAGQAYGAVAAGPLRPATGTPREALEDALRLALSRPPCVIAFSGGRDSSALLALAATVARRDGLDAPVALTQRFRNAPAAAEKEWQERVVAHVGVRDWELIEHDDELDCVGPVAQRALLRHGPICPPNAHFMIPMLERAQGGTLVTGLDGDMLFGGWHWARLGEVLARRRPPRARDLAAAGHRAAPVTLRRAVARRRARAEFPWLTTAARRHVDRLRARHVVVHPTRFDAYVEWMRTRRALVVHLRQLERLARAERARIAHPLLDPAFLSSLAARHGRHGPGVRTTALHDLFGDLLPPTVLERPTKASFAEVFMGSHTRRLARAWSGEGIDTELVIADELRRELAKPSPSPRVAMLVQSIWLAGSRT